MKDCHECGGTGVMPIQFTFGLNGLCDRCSGTGKVSDDSVPVSVGDYLTFTTVHPTEVEYGKVVKIEDDGALMILSSFHLQKAGIKEFESFGIKKCKPSTMIRDVLDTFEYLYKKYGKEIF